MNKSVTGNLILVVCVILLIVISVVITVAIIVAGPNMTLA